MKPCWNLKLNKLSILLLFIAFVAALTAFKQEYINPKSDYMFPIQPGAVNYLSGTMGEQRSNHFHAGIDIKTGGVEGLPVHASNKGYISRIKVSTWGYGNALYMLHPNGQTTVYAHLKKFNDEIARYVRQAQYEKQTFDIQLFPEKDQFSFNRGDIIAFSGNTGGSGGPHLHFEIRDEDQNVLNPLKYGFPEIKDDIPPTVERIALKTLNKTARINNMQGRFEFDVVKKGNNLSINEPVAVSGLVGIEVLTYDRLNGASNKNGVSCIQLNFDGRQIFNQNISKFSFALSRNILMLQNYKVYRQTGQRYNKLYVDDGNWLNFYETNDLKGKILVNDTLIHNVEINLWDNYSNKATLQFTLTGHTPSSVAQTDWHLPAGEAYRVNDNILKLFSPLGESGASCAVLFANRLKYELSPAYIVNNKAVYLWNLTAGLPDSVSLCGKYLRFNFEAMVPPKSAFNFYGNAMDIYFPRHALFDSLYLSTSYRYDSLQQRELYTINEDLVPFRKNIYITLKPKTHYPDKEKTAVYSISSNGYPGYEGGEWKNGNIQFRSRNLGTFTLLTDTAPPSIKIIQINKENISFAVKDELSGLNHFELKVNDKWVLMNYDYKRDLLWSEKLDNTRPFRGTVVLKVRDNAGNENTYTTKI